MAGKIILSGRYKPGSCFSGCNRGICFEHRGKGEGEIEESSCSDIMERS